MWVPLACRPPCPTPRLSRWSVYLVRKVTEARGYGDVPSTSSVPGTNVCAHICYMQLARTQHRGWGTDPQVKNPCIALTPSLLTTYRSEGLPITQSQ